MLGSYTIQKGVVAIMNVGKKHNIADLAEMICEKLSYIREKPSQLM